ncbi:MAG: class I SAM-dependent methyltransferase [Moheibacter sp.]
MKKFIKLKHYLKSKLYFYSYKKEIERIGNNTLSVVFSTIQQVKNNQYSEKDLSIFSNLNSYRKYLKENEQLIDYSIFNSKSRVVKEIYQSASSPEIWSRFHYLLTKNFNTKNYLEIGTNLGVSGSYILSALKEVDDSKFITMEGVPALCKLADKQFQTITDTSKFEVICGLYEDTFPELEKKPLQFDVFFIDGNHHYEPTLQYFRSLKTKAKSKAIFIFDDIYWTSEMTKVWNEIKEDTDINFALDLYKMGIVIIDKNEMNRNTKFNLFLTR